MCGIAGIYAYRESAPTVDEQELLRIREAMIHRGPDGAGLWVSPDRKIGLAHRRLAIIDLSEAGAQPMATADGNFRITFNGEIYNYRELRKELEAKGYRFRSNSDTEVLLHLYADRGGDMVHALRGMYAFALWDERKQAIFLARDPFGIKPLYYADDGGTVRVASQVKALLKGGAINTAPEPAGHVGFFLWGHVPEPYTLYKGIRALTAGTSLWIGAAGRKETRQFFNIADELRQASANRLFVTRDEMHARLRAALLESVRYHMVADVPVGIFLSAGLDSSTLTALARESDSTDLRTVTLGVREFQGTHNDETPLADLVAKRYGTLHQTSWVTKDDFQSALRHLLSVMDQPSTDAVNSYFVSKVAANAGLKVALSGLGGDELFGGYPSFRQIPASVSALGCFQSVPLLGKCFRAVSAPILKQFTSPKYASLFEYGGTYGGAYLLRRGMYMPWELPNVLDGEIIRQGWQELKTLLQLQQTTQGIRNARLKVTALESTWYMRNQLLRDSDWASMAHSIEMRTPFVDIGLFRATIPMLNSNNPPDKHAMASTPRLPLPRQTFQREKTGFLVPTREWMADKPRTLKAGKGLRDWATIVYREFGGDGLRSGVKAPIALIFRIGQLGDTLVALPAIDLIRRTLPAHRLVLLTDRNPTANDYVSSWDICRSTGWFERVIFYEPKTRGWLFLKTWVSLLFELRALRVDQFFNLAPNRSKWQALRDRYFFSAMVGVSSYHAPAARQNPKPDDRGRLPHLEPEWHRTIVSTRARHSPDIAFRLAIPDREQEEALRVAAADGVDFGGMLLAFGPGSKMPAKIWPTTRFASLGMRIRREFPDLQLVVLGGKEDIATGRELCSAWGEKAHNLAGRLSVYGSASILKRCAGYVGNDTGTMHLAAMVGITCVAIFSARDYPGRWDPYGKGHIVLRHDVDCAGCMLVACDEHDNKCLRLIGVDEVYQAVEQILVRAKLAMASKAPTLAENA